MSGFLWAVIRLVATTVASAELLEWCPPLQRLIIRRTAAGLPEAYRDRYLEEWQAELEALANGAVTRPHRTANRRDDLGPPGSPPRHVGTVQPDRVGPAAWVGEANVDRLAGPAQRGRLHQLLAVGFPHALATIGTGGDSVCSGTLATRPSLIGCASHGVLGRQRRSMRPSSVGALTG